MGDVERVRATFGSSFGAYSSRVNDALGKQHKKHQEQDEQGPHQNDDALELHEEGQEEVVTQTVHIASSQDDHLDLSA